ncbi:MAG: Sua5/YciO/YrdC/YwlC family protein [Pseudomonadota bacterium]|nr:Sua5/YciO/YrdC/YwlC family protein [Pseudomonadota bacterium]
MQDEQAAGATPAAPLPGEAGTGDPRPAGQVRREVSAVLDRLAEGGVGIVPLDVAYAIIAMRESGIRRIFQAKNRSYEKPSGMFGDWQLSREVHILPDRVHDVVRAMIEEVGLPFSVVAPFRADHPIFERVDPFVLANSSKGDTLDMLLNAGQVHDEIARQVRERGTPVFGSSANTSLAGSKYRYGDIEDQVRAAADIHLDHGLSKHANPHGRSSTIIDFSDFSVIRVGVRFDDLRQAFAERHGIELTINERTAQ